MAKVIIRQKSTNKYISSQGEVGDFLVKDINEATLMDKVSGRYFIEDIDAQEVWIVDENEDQIMGLKSDDFEAVKAKITVII